MDSVKIELVNGGPITFFCESFDMETANDFLADHGDDSTFCIHGFDRICGDLPGRSEIVNNGTSIMLYRDEVVSIEVV